MAGFWYNVVKQDSLIGDFCVLCRSSQPNTFVVGRDPQQNPMGTLSPELSCSRSATVGSSVVGFFVSGKEQDMCLDDLALAMEGRLVWRLRDLVAGWLASTRLGCYVAHVWAGEQGYLFVREGEMADYDDEEGRCGASPLRGGNDV
jgi:hypothetical protein